MNARPRMRSATSPRMDIPDPRKLRAVLDPIAAEDDRTDGAPMKGLWHLIECGASKAVLPPTHGGAAFGWSAQSSPALSEWLGQLGATHLSLARLYEGHVNAFQLIWTYASDEQRRALCGYVEEGGWLGVWNAPHASGPLRLCDDGAGGFVLEGMKAYASGAGLITRPLITAQHETLGYLMLWPQAKYQVGERTEWDMQGMRASVTLPVSYHHAAVHRGEIVGADNDYHREPLFTAGAWRFLAAQCGAGERLAELMAQSLVAVGRNADPHQRARMAEVTMAIESSRLWVLRARNAADGDVACDEATHQVRMARLAVERHLLDVIERVQRSVGLTAFRHDNPIERITRDLQTYLRQPVPDRVRDLVAEHAFARLSSDKPP